MNLTLRRQALARPTKRSCVVQASFKKNGPTLRDALLIAGPWMFGALTAGAALTAVEAGPIKPNKPVPTPSTATVAPSTSASSNPLEAFAAVSLADLKSLQVQAIMDEALARVGLASQGAMRILEEAAARAASLALTALTTAEQHSSKILAELSATPLPAPRVAYPLSLALLFFVGTRIGRAVGGPAAAPETSAEGPEQPLEAPALASAPVAPAPAAIVATGVIPPAAVAPAPSASAAKETSEPVAAVVKKEEVKEEAVKPQPQLAAPVSAHVAVVQEPVAAVSSGTAAAVAVKTDKEKEAEDAAQVLRDLEATRARLDELKKEGARPLPAPRPSPAPAPAPAPRAATPQPQSTSGRKPFSPLPPLFSASELAKLKKFDPLTMLDAIAPRAPTPQRDPLTALLKLLSEAPAPATRSKYDPLASLKSWDPTPTRKKSGAAAKYDPLANGLAAILVEPSKAEAKYDLYPAVLSALATPPTGRAKYDPLTVFVTSDFAPDMDSVSPYDPWAMIIASLTLSQAPREEAGAAGADPFKALVKLLRGLGPSKGKEGGGRPISSLLEPSTVNSRFDPIARERETADV